jgi:hypothetical protein
MLLLLVTTDAMRRIGQAVDVRMRTPIYPWENKIQRPDKSIDNNAAPITQPPPPPPIEDTTVDVRELPSNLMECEISSRQVEVLTEHTMYFVETSVVAVGPDSKRREMTTYCIATKNFELGKTDASNERFWVRCRKCDLERQRSIDESIATNDTMLTFVMLILLGFVAYVILLVLIGLFANVYQQRRRDKISMLTAHANMVSQMNQFPHKKSAVDVTPI